MEHSKQKIREGRNSKQPLETVEEEEEQYITMEELDDAIKNLPKGKAIGVDELPDKLLKRKETWMAIKKKILDTFNEWLENNHMPQYILTTRIVPLSKTESVFPPTGDVRTIAVAPALTKLLELCIKQKLDREI